MCLGYGEDHPQLLVIGGRDKNMTVLHDTWMLDLKSGIWREVRFGSTVVWNFQTPLEIYPVSFNSLVQVDVPGYQSRCWHSANAFTLSPGLTEVTIFGGCPEWPRDIALTTLANTTVLRFEYGELYK